MRTRTSVDQAVSAFESEYPGRVLAARLHGSGHIHDTFVLRWAAPGKPERTLLVQRFNTDVFTDPAGVMHNIERVSAHLRSRLPPRAGDPARRVLQLVPASAGRSFWTSATGATYRAFEFIAGAEAYELAPSAHHAFEAGRAFGEFVARLIDLPGPPLGETIAGFHDTEARLQVLRGAFEADPLGRGAALLDERAQVEARSELAGLCNRLAADGGLPHRVIHNDAKLSNLLFDAQTDEALCVVDLDTVMPGFAAYDFGDLVRTTACRVAEDAALGGSDIEVRMDYLVALANGYVGALGGASTAAERESLISGPKLICYELGMRFLTDHVLGDRYFAIDRPGQNLDRARVQLALVDALERREADLRASIERASAIA